MDQNLENKTNITNKVQLFYQKNKIKIYFFTFFILIFFCAVSMLDYFKQKKNNLIAEKYIEVGLILNSNNKQQAKKILDEIILSKNKFYSILALNTILEKNLETDKEKMLEYFKILEKLKLTKEQKDIILFKKALYLISLSDNQAGKKLLNDLIDSDSSLKFLAEEIIRK